MKSIKEMNEIMAQVEDQWERSIDLLRKIVAGEKVYFIDRDWKNESMYENDDDYTVTEQAYPAPFGGYYSLVYTKVEYEKALFIGDEERVQHPWLICPLFMSAFGEYTTNVNITVGGTEKSTGWYTSRKEVDGKWEIEPLEFNIPLVKALLDAIDGVGIEMTSYPENVRQASAMGLDTRFFM